MRWSIRWQLLAPVLALLLGIAAISWWTANSAAAAAREQIESQIRRVARTLSEYSFPLNESVLLQMKGLSGAEYVLRRQGEAPLATLADLPGALPGDQVVVTSWQELRLGPRISVARRGYLSGAVLLPAGRGRDGSVLFILFPEEMWRDTIWTAVQPSLLLGGISALMALTLAFLSSQRLGRRIADLQLHTRVIAQGDFRSRTPEGMHDELRELATSINDMARRLAELQEEAQRNERLRLLGQVSGGLAHQLRNSVTGARLAIQVHLRESQSPATEALDVALRQLDLVESSLKRFLDLGRAELGPLESCDLDCLVDEILTLLRPQCRHAQVELQWHRCEEPLRVRADISQLRHAIHNLLANAVEAAGIGGWVRVVLNRLNHPAPRVVLSVHDSGPGPTSLIAERLFEPFVTGKPEGVGLGLAVARRVVESQGGSIGWHRQPDRTCFWIELPEECAACRTS